MPNFTGEKLVLGLEDMTGGNKKAEWQFQIYPPMIYMDARQLLVCGASKWACMSNMWPVRARVKKATSAGEALRRGEARFKLHRKRERTCHPSGCTSVNGQMENVIHSDWPDKWHNSGFGCCHVPPIPASPRRHECLVGVFKALSRLGFAAS
jgi:hypothetical protein